MLHVIRQNKSYFICLGLYFLAGAITLLVFPKGQLELLINQRHTVLLDYFFLFITYLGDGLFIFPFILLIFLFDTLFKGLVMTVSVFSTFLTVQFLKIFVFPEMLRPSAYFPNATSIYYVPGLEVHSHNSFPSGHSAQAFAFLLVLALFSKNKKTVGVAFFVFALLTALSRVYLMQHFLIDTYFGALIATVLTCFTYLYFTNYTTLSEKEHWQKGLIW